MLSAQSCSYQRFIQNATNQIAAFLRCHGHTWVQILHDVIMLIEVIGKHAPRNINCNVTSRNTVNFCILAEQLHVFQVTKSSPAGVRGWLCETTCSQTSSLGRVLFQRGEVDLLGGTGGMFPCLDSILVRLHLVVSEDSVKWPLR